MGLRQGSGKDQHVFLALYDIATWEVKTEGDRTAITAQQQGIDTEVNVSDLKFMDDLVSFFEFLDLDTLQRFIECVSEVFTQHSFQVNVGKLEELVQMHEQTQQTHCNFEVPMRFPTNSCDG